jgi:hypothetical protein
MYIYLYFYLNINIHVHINIYMFKYAAHLWELAAEADDGDLYVPLEFDTEWESAEALPDYSDTESGHEYDEYVRRNRETGKKKVIQLKKKINIDVVEYLLGRICRYFIIIVVFILFLCLFGW